MISKLQIVLKDANTYTQKVFSSTNEKHLFDIELDKSHYPGATLITDGAVLLVTDRWGSKLCKYELSPYPDPIWTYGGLRGPDSVAVDESGLIYLASDLEPAIHIICPDKGKIG